MGEEPGKVLNFLERHPKVMLTSAGVASFVAIRKELLGGAEVIVDKDGVAHVVAKPGALERAWRHTTDRFHAPLAGIILMVGLVLLSWAAIQLWGAFRIQKAKVRIAASQLATQAERESAGSTPKAPRE